MSIITNLQRAVLVRMIETGEPLQRWPGWFWTTRGTPLAEPQRGAKHPAPAWYCVTSTVLLLEQRGWLTSAGIHTDPDRDDRILTEAGRQAVAELEEEAGLTVAGVPG